MHVPNSGFSLPFLFIETGNFILSAFCFRHAWRQGRYPLFIMASAMVYGFLLEYSAVTSVPQQYHYNYFIFQLPGPVPLGVVLGWGVIFYAVTQTAMWLAPPWALRPVICGFLAVSIDFIMDPLAVALNFWTWTESHYGQWFGIPWDNYVGWFVVISSLSLMQVLGFRWFPPGEKGLFRDFLVAFLAIVPAFFADKVIMNAYERLVKFNPEVLPEALIVALFFGFFTLLTIPFIPKLKRDRSPDSVVLAVPLYTYAWILVSFFAIALYKKFPELVIVIPVFVLLGVLGFCWPYFNKILSLKLSEEREKNNKLKSWLPWALLIVFAWFCFFHHEKGFIGQVELPKDDAFLKQEPVQWWYWTGHLETVETEEPRRFGFQIVFFAFRGFGAQLAQTAITDVTGDSFHFKEYVHFSLPKEIPNQFDLAAGPGNRLIAKGGNGKDSLHAEVDDYVLGLSAVSAKPPVLHYGGNVHPFIYGGNTYYYSREKMEANGTLKIGEETFKVKGTAWFDRQYGELYQAIAKGWQWFAIELEDGREIMLYDYRGKYADVERYGSITGPGNQTRNLGPKDYKVEKLGEWKSPHTGCVYPMGWNLTIGDLKIKVEPLVVDQELRAQHHFWAGPEYWEGACSVAGDVNGKAYVELNGYCRGVEGTIDF